MEHAFWFARWQEGRIGFHEGCPNTFLDRHHAWLAPCRRLLVPLCGKAEDLAYLAGQGHEVIGVELVEDAVRQFFDEHHTTPAITRAHGFVAYEAGPIRLLSGDLFAAPPELVGPIDGVYDRAALIALPPEQRARYAGHLRAIAPAARRTLLVSVDYPPGSMEGPPFSVDESEVRALFHGHAVRLLDQAADARGRAGGQLVERCFALDHTGG